LSLRLPRSISLRSLRNGKLINALKIYGETACSEPVEPSACSELVESSACGELVESAAAK
jgi:hypothetical protein